MEVCAGVGVTIGALVGSGMLDAETGPATGVLVGGIGVLVGATVGAGGGAGSCPQAIARASASAMEMMARVGFMRDVRFQSDSVCVYGSSI